MLPPRGVAWGHLWYFYILQLTLKHYGPVPIARNKHGLSLTGSLDYSSTWRNHSRTLEYTSKAYQVILHSFNTSNSLNCVLLGGNLLLTERGTCERILAACEWQYVVYVHTRGSLLVDYLVH